MSKKRIIIWGGNFTPPLKLENIDSHASINAYFLTQHLQHYFEVINITNIDMPEEILKYDNIHAIISTAQLGFTNRIINKGKISLYNKIVRHTNAKLCSITDDLNVGKYYEDILFCIRPINNTNIDVIRKKSNNKYLEIVNIGWCASPDVFYSEDTKINEINIFIDHAPYNKNALNLVSSYFNALKIITNKFPEKIISVYHQNDEGIVKWDFKGNQNVSRVYNREKKTPYLTIADIYRKIHIFCVTHKESAGLSSIEAAMCGAKLYIPKDLFGRSFIHNDLVDKSIEHKFLSFKGLSVKKQLILDINNGINKAKNRNQVLNSSKHTWQDAAKIIKNTILK
jgi:hypothetical protein